MELGGGVLAVAFLARVVSDTSSGLDGLRWATPLGWAEEVRPFAGARPAVFVLAAVTTLVLAGVARRISLRRDVGSGLVSGRDSRPADLALLSSPARWALRDERTSLVVWALGCGLFALVVGVLSDTVSSVSISSSLQRQLDKLGAGSITTASGYLSFTFLFFVLVVSLFACAQVGAARHEEADGRLETMLALAVARRSWLAGRLALAAAGMAALALLAGLMAWVGAASQGAGVSLGDALAAGANCLPAALLFLALAALAFAVAPRASVGVAYGLVSLAFVWQTFGSLLGVPDWTLGLSPFHQVGLVPVQSFKATAAVVMVALAAVIVAAAMALFERRDLAGI